ncbi:site-specific integrase [Herbaspirillum sp. YR522]|uniref:tyrosine-type recombinase/integrase n=1 Tax=Herbaspirillum sp. YR522 TaxID=1144342 RepID=UPI00026FA286|nr:site-specific integrase [Herbaspirillum sp. YR522]EJN06440.1 site-specific recombinase XerD [Herbaspirillum sp. YR522]
MGITYDETRKRYIARIRRRGVAVKKSFDTKAQAEAFERAALQQIFEQGDLGKKQRHTLDEAIEKYLLDEVPNHRSNDRVKSNIRALMPHTEGLYLDQISDAAAKVRAARRQSRRPLPEFETPEQRKARLVAMTKLKPLTSATINRRLAILRRVANLAYKEWHWIDRPISVRLLPEHNQRHEYLSAEQVDELAAACRAPANHMTIVAAYTGMRRGELLGLTKSNIRGDNIFLGLTKNGRPKLVPISPRVKPALEAWIKADKPDPRTLYKYFKAGARSIGKKTLRFHDLRHTTASFLLNMGFDLATVAEVLNCTIQNAQRYAHLSIENKKHALHAITNVGGQKSANAMPIRRKMPKTPKQ